MNGIARYLRRAWRVFGPTYPFIQLPHPFQLCRYAHWRTADRSGPKGEAGADPIYLWPHGLRWSFLWCAVFFAYAVVLTDLANWLLLLVVALLVFVYPLIVFHWQRRPVLRDLWDTWPPPLVEAYRDTSPLITEPGDTARQWVGRLVWALLPKTRGWTSAIDQQARKASLGKAALADFFASQPSDAGIWCDRGFLRWLATRCGPVVAGQTTMLILLFFAADQGIGKQLQIWVLTWTGIAAGFLWHAACSYEKEIGLSLEDLRNLPYLSRTLENSNLSERIPGLTVPLVVTVAGINLPAIITLVLK